MKFLTIFAFACVASFVVLHGVFGSPVPVPKPGPEPKPVADPAPKAEPKANPEPVAKPNPVASPNPLSAASAKGPEAAAGGEGSFLPLSANAEPVVPNPEASPLRNDDVLAI